MSRALPALLAVFAFVTLALAAAAFTGLRAPQAAPPALRPAAALNRIADKALAETPPDLAGARAATEAALRQAPYDPSAWLRLAYMDSLDGELGAEGVEALARSYALLPYDQYVAFWRIRFALENWPALTPDLREAVRAETFAFGRTYRYLQLRNSLRSVENPAGRLAAVLWVERMRQDRVRERAERAKAAQSAGDKAPN